MITIVFYLLSIDQKYLLLFQNLPEGKIFLLLYKVISIESN
jgi:hypothetical protein